MRLLSRIVAIIAPPDTLDAGSAAPTTRASHALFVFVPTSPDAATADEAPSRSRERAPIKGGVVDLRVLQERLTRAMDLQHAGRFEGVQPADSGILLSLSGPNADRLAAVVLPLLRAAHLPRGTTVIRRFGGPGAREARTLLPTA